MAIANDTTLTAAIKAKTVREETTALMTDMVTQTEIADVTTLLKDITTVDVATHQSAPTSEATIIADETITIGEAGVVSTGILTSHPNHLVHAHLDAGDKREDVDAQNRRIHPHHHHLIVEAKVVRVKTQKSLPKYQSRKKSHASPHQASWPNSRTK